MKARRIKTYSKVIARSMRGRSYRKFHNNKSLPRTVINIGRFTVKHGIRYTIRQARLVVISSGAGQHLFPNGLVSGVNIEELKLWYKQHAKKVSIVIPSYNDYDILEICIESIKRFTDKDKYHIFIVDDYCTKDSRESLSKFEQEDITIIYRNKNGGFSKAVNSGLRAALKKYPSKDVVLVNSDIVAHDGWLAGLQHGAYCYDKGVGIVGPKLLYPDGRIQSAGSYRNTEAPEFFDHYYRFQQSDYGPANVPQYCIGVTGACFYITNKTIKTIGILDERFPFAFEDADYCLRAWEKGIKTLYYPASTLTHMESATRAKNKTISERERGSLVYFWQKWGDWFDKRNVRNKDGKIRIIFVLQTTGVSGGIRIVIEHCNRLFAMGYDVELWSLDAGPQWMELSTKHRGFKNYKQLTQALSQEEAIKVATWWETAHPVWNSSVTKGIPVYFIQEMETWFYPNDAEAQRTVVACYRKEFRNMTTSAYNLDEIKALGLNATKIPCGYDDRVFHQVAGLKRDDNTLLAVGRTFFQKNLKLTLDGWKLLGTSRPKLLLFGSEPRIAEWDNRIEYVTKPSDDEVNELYNKATVFTQTSYHEGFCLPILEAMAAGCPVVCTDSHGNRDFCFDGKNCLLIPNDDPEEMKKAIKKILESKKLQIKFSKEGLKTARSYRWDAVMKDVAKFYDDVASPREWSRLTKGYEK